MSLVQREHRRTYLRESMRRLRAAATRASMLQADSQWSSEFQALPPTMQAAITPDDIGRRERGFISYQLDPGKLCDLLAEGFKRFHYGDIRGGEIGLLCQVNTLSRIFHLCMRWIVASESSDLAFEFRGHPALRSRHCQISISRRE